MLLRRKQNTSFPPFYLSLPFSVLGIQRQWMSDANSFRAEMVLYNNREREGACKTKKEPNSVLAQAEMETGNEGERL